MSERRDERERTIRGPEGGAPAPRSAYEPPRILFREPLETLAVVCTPNPPAKGTIAVCPDGPLSS
ncbi:MAG: hypothetical protein KA189_10545 [Thermoanaerobaculia bacterium]|nr:hypothetical protein [Thermoanaerobaculia bacterium]